MNILKERGCFFIEWEKFYLCCEQCHRITRLGLGVIKKYTLSFLRPCENIRNGLLTRTLPLEPTKHNRKELDIKRLLDALSYMEKVLPIAFQTDHSKKVFRGEQPIAAIQDIFIELQ